MQCPPPDPFEEVRVAQAACSLQQGHFETAAIALELIQAAPGPMTSEEQLFGQLLCATQGGQCLLGWVSDGDEGPIEEEEALADPDRDADMDRKEAEMGLFRLGEDLQKLFPYVRQRYYALGLPFQSRPLGTTSIGYAIGADPDDAIYHRLNLSRNLAELNTSLLTQPALDGLSTATGHQVALRLRLYQSNPNRFLNAIFNGGVALTHTRAKLESGWETDWSANGFVQYAYILAPFQLGGLLELSLYGDDASTGALIRTSMGGTVRLHHLWAMGVEYRNDLAMGGPDPGLGDHMLSGMVRFLPLGYDRWQLGAGMARNFQGPAANFLFLQASWTMY